jgi:hypothetical protein
VNICISLLNGSHVLRRNSEKETSYEEEDGTVDYEARGHKGHKALTGEGAEWTREKCKRGQEDEINQKSIKRIQL